MTDPRAPIFAAVRQVKPDVFNDPTDGARRIGALDSLLDAFGVPRAGQVAKPSSSAAVGPAKSPAVPPSPTAREPLWLIEARELIGQREIPGPQHNRWIADGWKRLGAGWFTDDETPWCGLFVAHCIEAAGLPFPKLFPRAKAWADWGVPCPPTVGAVVVFGRQGGGHVGFLVGESHANYYVLGGNQSNAVNIMPIAKSRKVAIRWPAQKGRPAQGLPQMAGGVVSTNEA
jgi:uncharacterized protein (TIGR02594 family)